jgi:hypothetical protein
MGYVDPIGEGVKDLARWAVLHRWRKYEAPILDRFPASDFGAPQTGEWFFKNYWIAPGRAICIYIADTVLPDSAFNQTVRMKCKARVIQLLLPNITKTKT